jgi:hypothetical protein
MELIQRDSTHPKDKKKISLFYILSGNDDLYAKSNGIYDFSNHQIKPECLNDSSADFCSSSRALIRLGYNRLGYNLYNNYQEGDNTSPINKLSGLDDDTDNFFLATESLGVRFGHEYIHAPLMNPSIGG